MTENMTEMRHIRGLDAIPAGDMPNRAPAPVETWHPEHAGSIDIAIDIDGNWFHDGTPIRRAGLVALFASILRREPDGSYVLVTPVEKRTISIADVPFVAVGILVEGKAANQVVTLTTNVGDAVTIDNDHPMRFAAGAAAKGVSLPYVTIRGGLEARVARAVFPDLVDAGCVEDRDGDDWFGVWSSGVFWPMMPADEAGA
ncbi:DUF1285 domain-containing protein [Anderseniella sp. Alg231-50]|uniref:DUF1285 domain-containing protein n=1 Tax=Anderseniella sp. Alg231-50 TaxID=1922226 RepID=UPI00307B1A10